MPNATSSAAPKRFDLTTLEGGYIEAKRLSYGEKIQRRVLTSNMVMRGDSKSKNLDMEMNFASQEATLFDFSHCIVDHNLFKDDEETQKFDFGSIQDIRQLDPRIGEEIETFLDGLNNFEADEGN